MITSNITAEATRDQFMQLLVTQLRYQDPLEPVKQENFLQQLAQFATLEGIEELNANFEDLLRLQELTQGAHLIGKSVLYQREGDFSEAIGVVDSVRAQDDRLVVVVDGQTIPLDRIHGLVAD
jgi:flagellar basal-body rod modification protein FlgD